MPQSNFSLPINKINTSRIYNVVAIESGKEVKTVHKTANIKEYTTLAKGNYEDDIISSDSKDNWSNFKARSNVFNYKQYYNFIWLIGMGLIIIYILTASILFNTKIKRSQCIYDKRVAFILNDCLEKLHIKTKLEVKSVSSIKTPCIYGLITPKLLLPKGISESLNDKELKYIFIHELIHLKRKDMLINWLLLVLGAVYWFNPIVLYALHCIRRDCELACDEGVIDEIGNNEINDYGSIIINLIKRYSKGSFIPGAAGIAFTSEAKRRIVMLNNYKKKSLKSLVVGLILVFTIGTFGLMTGFSSPNNETSTKTMKNFSDLLKKNSKEIEIIKFVDKNISLVSPKNASDMVISLEALQKRNIDKLSDKFYSNDIQNKMIKEFRSGINTSKFEIIKDKKLRDLLINARNSGYKVETAEGTYFPIINYEFYNKYEKYVTNDIKEYIRIMTVESNKVPVKDGGLMISWVEVLNRAFSQEHFVDTYRDSAKQKDVKELLNQYLSYVMFGLNNTPLFSYDTKLMNSEAKAAYIKVLSTKKDSHLAQILNSYYDQIIKNRFILDNTLDGYRKKVINTTKF